MDSRISFFIKDILLAFAATAAALLIHLAISPLLINSVSFVLFLAAVLVCARLRGLYSGLAATLFSTLTISYFLLSPVYSFWGASISDLLHLGLFFVIGVGISFVCEYFLIARRRAEAEHAQLELEIEQRQQAEKSEREQRERLEVTLSSIGDAVIATDAGGKVTFLNQVAEDLTGWKQIDAAGRPLDEVFRIVNEKSRQPVESPVSKVLREGGIVGLANHTVLIEKDGTECAIEDSAAPMRDAAGAISGIVMVFRDASEQRRTEMAQAERLRLMALRSDVSLALALNQSLREALQQCAEGIVLHLNDADMVEVAFARIWTLDHKENVLELQASAGLYTHLDGGHARVKVGEFKIGRIAQSRQPHLTNDVPNDPNVGDPAWAKSEGMKAFAGYPLIVEEQVYGVLALFARTPLSEDVLGDLRPIADAVAQFINRKQLEENLGLSEHRYALVEEATNDGVWDWNPVTGDDYLSPQWKALLGFSAAELANTEDSFFSRVHPEDAERVSEAVRLHFDEQKPYQVELRLRCKDDSYRWFRSRGKALRDENGTFVRMVGTITDIDERKRAKQALLESHQYSQSVLDSMSEHVAVLDRKGTITAVNSAWCEFAHGNARNGDVSRTGIGINYLAICGSVSGPSSKDARRALEGIQSVLNGTNSFFVHEYPCHAPREERWFQMSVTPLPTSSGGALVSHLNVTERKLSEQKIKEQQEQVVTLAESIPQLAWMADADGNIHWYNRRWYEYTGTTPEQMKDLDWQSFIDPATVSEVNERWNASVESGKPLDMVFPLRGADDVFRLFLTRVVPQRNQKDEIVQWFGTNTDIDDAKRIETELRRGAARAKFLAQASADFAELTDDQSTMQKIASIAVPDFADWCAVDMAQPGGALQRLVAKHIDSAKARLAFELLERYPPQPDDPHGVYAVFRTGQAEMAQEISDSLLVESAIDEEHLHILRTIGLESYICVPMKSKGKIMGVLTFVTSESGRRFNQDDLLAAEDLGRRAAIAIENASLYRELQEADRRKDEFLATLAHELRNPLAPIRTGLHVLKMAKNDPAIAADAQTMMNRQLNHLVRLVDDLLDISRITRGKMELRRERVELSAIVESAVESSRPLIDQQEQELTVVLPPEPVWLDADATRLAQVLQNLLNNAAKYSEKGGRIHLSAVRSEDEIVISVRDTGIGISANHLPHIFDMFSQVESALEKSQGGLGIGLSLVKGLVNMHDGQVEARSDGAGKGSELIIRLPVLIEKSAVAAGHLENAGAENNGVIKHRILVVDDNEDSTTWLATMLNIMGHETRTAHDGVAGIAVAAEFQPNIILMDIGMPKMNGYEAAHHIRQESWGKNTILVALTGWGAEDDRRRTQAAGFNRHLVKPVDPTEIENLLAELDQK